MRVYATREQLAEWLNPLPDEARTQTLLREASILVGKATRFDRYAVTAAGYPKDAFVKCAFKEATCAQAAEWELAEIDPAAGIAGQEPIEESTAIAGASVKYAASVQAAAQQATLTTLSQRAFDILRNEGLASQTPTVI